MYIVESLLTTVLGHMATPAEDSPCFPRDVQVNLWARGVLHLMATYASTNGKLSSLNIRFCEAPDSLSTFMVHYDFTGNTHGVIIASGPGGTGYKHRVTAACQAMAFPARFPERKRDTFALLNRLVFEKFV